MSPPIYYGIEYEINPWMDVKNKAGRETAITQWKMLKEVLTHKMGIRVEILPAVKGLPDLVFTANGGLVREKVFIPANFRFHERKKEEPYFLNWFRSAGYKVIEPNQGILFEGEGDMLASGETLFAGYRYRSDILSHEWVSEILGIQVLSLELVDPKFYHLDTCFCPLPAGELLYYSKAFDKYALQVINDSFPPDKRIEVEEKEALRFACNAVAYKDKLVINSGCKKLRDELEMRGYTVFEVDLSEFIKSGGSAKCLTLWI